MSIEALWYSSHRDGRRPHCRRISRLPMRHQFEAAIHLAISIEHGGGSRNTYIARTGELYWYAPLLDQALAAEAEAEAEGLDPAEVEPPGIPSHATGWWLVPYRVDRRAWAIWSAAENAIGYGRRTRLAVLEQWRATGHWRRIAAGIFPRRPKPPTTSRRTRGTIPDLRVTLSWRPVRPAFDPWEDDIVERCAGCGGRFSRVEHYAVSDSPHGPIYACTPDCRAVVTNDPPRRIPRHIEWPSLPPLLPDARLARPAPKAGRKRGRAVVNA